MKTPKGILSKPSLVVVVMVGLTLGLTMPAQSTLIDRGLFEDGLGGMMKLIYDDDLGITWLGDANFGAGSAFDNGSSTTDGRMTWGNAVNWAGSLTVGDFTDWRLPNAQNQDGSGPCTGNGCTDSEIGHVYFIELGNVGNTSGCTLGVNCGLVNTGPFSNLQADFYWSGTESAPVIVGGQLVFTAWFFNPFTGNQDAENKLQNFFPWAVRDGDFGPATSKGNAYHQEIRHDLPLRDHGPQSCRTVVTETLGS